MINLKTHTGVLRYGVAYQGSKNAIAKEIVSILPPNKRLVELFSGGCAVTHCAMTLGKYERYLVNDLKGFGQEVFIKAITGQYSREELFRWVSRKEFEAKRDTDPLISIYWSFSNNMRHYLYGYDKEERMRLGHLHWEKTGVYRDFDIRIAAGDSHIESLSHIARLSHIESLSHIERLSHIESLSLDYSKVPINANEDTVYADPPYKGTDTKGYAEAFDSDAFFEWARTRPFPVFISEYTAPKDFTPIWKRGKTVLCDTRGTSYKKLECLFVQEKYAAKYQTELF